jgi:hypothetical protein
MGTHAIYYSLSLIQSKKPCRVEGNWGGVEIFLLKVYGWLEEILPFRRFRSPAVSMSLR